MAVSYVKFHCFVEDLAEKKHNLGSDTLCVALSNVAPNAATGTVIGDITEIAYTNLASNPTSRQFTATTSAQTSGTYTLDAADIVLTASGGALPTFRYVVIYNDTAAADNLICYYDSAVANNITDGSTYKVTFDPTGILTNA